MSKISVCIKEPGKLPRHVNIENTLKNLQRTVDGYIEIVRIAQDLVMIVNEEGKIRGLEPNFELCGDLIVGTAILCGEDGEDLTDLPCSWAQLKTMIPQLWKGLQNATD